jgi:beta-glucosidase
MNAVKANVASVMCSYNKVNESWACESDAILNELMKKELGFRGYIMSDWNAQHTTVNSALSGLDMTMPGSDFNNPPGSIFWGPHLAAAVANGAVPQSRLDNMVTRILAAWYLVEQDKGYPEVAFSSWNGGKASVDVTGNHAAVVRQVARDSIILLKNQGKALPLRHPKSLAIIGEDAIVNPDGPNGCSDRGCDNGTLAMGWGSGTAQFPVSSEIPDLVDRNIPKLTRPFSISSVLSVQFVRRLRTPAPKSLPAPPIMLLQVPPRRPLLKPLWFLLIPTLAKGRSEPPRVYLFAKY